MTNETIIILEPKELKNNHDLLFEEINGKPFLHYQLSYLSENLFTHVVFIIPENENRIHNLFGSEYLDLKITYLTWNQEIGTGGNIHQALNFVNDTFAFVLSAENYFRLNFKKADDFRRMRDARILHIGKKAMDFKSQSAKLFLNEKGKITNIIDAESTNDEDTYLSDTWLINKRFFAKEFLNKSFSLFDDFLKIEYKSSPQYCLACRQYLINMEENKDLEKAKYEFAEYYYR